MTVDFEQAEYSVSEDGLLEVCVVLMGSIELNVTVILSAGEIADLPDSDRANRESLHYLYATCDHLGTQLGRILDKYLNPTSCSLRKINKLFVAPYLWWMTY